MMSSRPQKKWNVLSNGFHDFGSPGFCCRPMKYGCHGATVEMQGTPSISHWVETGLVVSGVEATSIIATSSLTISSLATSAARFGIGLAVLDDDLDVDGLAAELEAALHRFEKALDDEVVGLAEGGERARCAG